MIDSYEAYVNECNIKDSLISNHIISSGKGDDFITRKRDSVLIDNTPSFDISILNFDTSVIQENAQELLNEA